MPYAANDWYDVYINGVLKQFSVPLREYMGQTPDNVQFIDLYNLDFSTGWWDQIWVSTPGMSPLIFENDFERGSSCGWSVVSG